MFARLSWLAGVGSLVAAVLLTARPAEAQSCHALELTEPDERPFRTTLGLQVASYDTGREQGDYQGLYAGVSYQRPWFGAEVVLPAYRLTRKSGTHVGLGDLVVTARASALRLRDGAIELGVALPVMVPTGSASSQLGMGHVMLMPALWFSLDLAPFALRAQAGYGRALGGDEHANHTGEQGGHHGHEVAVPAGLFPLVNPMNRSELEHGLALGLRVQRHIGVHARWFGALPLGEGALRQVVGAGATAELDPVELLVEVQVPAAGDPFQAKLITQVALAF